MSRSGKLTAAAYLDEYLATGERRFGCLLEHGVLTVVAAAQRQHAS
jgi:hypothetical protein